MPLADVAKAAQYIDGLLHFESTYRPITLVAFAFPAVPALKQREVIDLIVVIVLQGEIRYLEADDASHFPAERAEEDRFLLEAHVQGIDLAYLPLQSIAFLNHRTRQILLPEARPLFLEGLQMLDV